jgi:hypothetical protein
LRDAETGRAHSTSTSRAATRQFTWLRVTLYALHTFVMN